MSSTQQMFKSGKARGEGEAEANQWADSIGNKASDCTQSAQENKEHAAGFIQQTGQQMKQMAQGAADTIKNAVGMGDSNNPPASCGSTTSTTTTTRR